jgi:hypothetical protein
MGQLLTAVGFFLLILCSIARPVAESSVQARFGDLPLPSGLTKADVDKLVIVVHRNRSRDGRIADWSLIWTDGRIERRLRVVDKEERQEYAVDPARVKALLNLLEHLGLFKVSAEDGRRRCDACLRFAVRRGGSVSGYWVVGPSLWSPPISGLQPPSPSDRPALTKSTDALRRFLHLPYEDWMGEECDELQVGQVAKLTRNDFLERVESWVFQKDGRFTYERGLRVRRETRIEPTRLRKVIEGASKAGLLGASCDRGDFVDPTDWRVDYELRLRAGASYPHPDQQCLILWRNQDHESPARGVIETLLRLGGAMP